MVSNLFQFRRVPASLPTGLDSGSRGVFALAEPAPHARHRGSVGRTMTSAERRMRMMVFACCQVRFRRDVG